MEGICDDSVHSFLTTVTDEDSVDIYSGMDSSPHAVTAKPCALLSPRMKESMDLYEEIITEEQKSRDSTYNELKARFIAAQSQIEELRRRVQQMEIQNTGLSTENTRLKKNICALLRTARQEVLRKDEVIERLNLRSGRMNHYQPHTNGMRDSVSIRHKCLSDTTSKPPPPPVIAAAVPPPPPPPPCSPPPLPPPLPPFPPPSPVQHPPQSMPTEDCLQISSHHTNNENGCTAHTGTTSSTNVHSRSSLKGASETLAKQTEPSLSKFSSDSSFSEPDKQKQAKQREEKYERRRISESSDRRHRSCSDAEKNTHTTENQNTHRTQKEGEKKCDQKSCKIRIHQDGRGHHRSERAKSPQPYHSRKASSSHGSKGLNEEGRKGTSRDMKHDKSQIAASDSSVHKSRGSCKDSSEIKLKSSCSQEQRQIKTADMLQQHVRNSSNSKDRKQPCSVPYDKRSSESKQKGVVSPSREQRKAERRQQDNVKRDDKRTPGLERSRESEKAKHKGQVRSETELSSKDRGRNRTNGILKRQFLEPNRESATSVEDSSPNMKLSFMETLNLTLSPVKKPVLPIDPSLQGVSPAEAVLDSGSNDDEQPRIEDMCVLDEIINSSSEMDADETDRVAEPSSANPKSLKMDKAGRNIVDVNVVIEENKNSYNNDMVKEQFEGNVQKEGCVDPATDYLTNGIPILEATSTSTVTTTESIIENVECLLPHNNMVISGDSEATSCLGVTSGSLLNLDKSSQKINLENQPGKNILIEPSLLDSGPESPTTAHKEDTIKPSLGSDIISEDVNAKSNTEVSSYILPDGNLQHLSPSTISSSIIERESGDIEQSLKDADPVSSTITLDAFPKEGLSLPEAIYVFTQTSENVNNSESEPCSSTGFIEVSKVSSTTEEASPLGKHRALLALTPRKFCSPGKSDIESEGNIKPYSSVSLPHDEDSMMLTLRNLKSIPDAISPLRSPIRFTRRSHPSCSKPPHVKSLQNNFLSSSVALNPKKVDVNKENKYPATSKNHEPQKDTDKAQDLPSSQSDNELEEGEILSESEDGNSISPINSPKTAKLKQPASHPSPTLTQRTSKLKSERKIVIASSGSPSNKSCFKTICPTTSDAFTNMEDVMDTFKAVQTQVRKKYMKLHKMFPKKSFYGMMENFQESFLECVNGARLCKICSEEGELKAKLRKIITSVFNTVTNNGIVKRIFEQQAVNLKQKLWDFVNVQLDFLFKEIYSTLKSFNKPTEHHPDRMAAEEKSPNEHDKLPKKPSVRMSPKFQQQQKDGQSVKTNLRRIRPHPVACKTGLGSRGKDIRISSVDNDTHKVVELLPNISSTPEKPQKASFVLSQSVSLQDRSDFEILTEQQASSLTFNLVRDSQMGEIFKCLLQGSDLLDSSVTPGDNTAWTLSTPKKDGQPVECFTSPDKLVSPSKLIASWSSISPHKISSPQSKVHLPLNPELLDESCLLEVPSGTNTLLHPSFDHQRTFSILAEDLAVSLTIPSPLKSDSHLSFLQPSALGITSTPQSVISAHLGEDALLDGEDATEQDIHLALDTDISSCGSSSSLTPESTTLTFFQYKPHLPIEAVVMEKSTDHFVLKIRQEVKSADVTITADESLSKTLTEDDKCYGSKLTFASTTKAPLLIECSEKSVSPLQKTPPSEMPLYKPAGSPETNLLSEDFLSKHSVFSEEEVETSAMSDRLMIAEDDNGTPEREDKHRKIGRKRKNHQENAKSKRAKKDENCCRKNKVSKLTKDSKTKTSKKQKRKCKSPSVPLSPNSLSAKNLIKKKGEVVIAWTREEDRAILIELKTKGASRETFSALAEQLNKSSHHIAERFGQLMKLFKKKEKMET